MSACRASFGVWVGTLVVLVGASGCEGALRLLDEAAAALEASPTPATSPVEEESPAALPERPATSTVHSETQVITFGGILDNREMSREARIRAFENLDPAALQKPVARSNVTAAPPGARRQPQPSTQTPSEISAARSRVPVVMYSTAWCGVCKRARQYFQQAGISFVEHDVDEDPKARQEYLRLNPRRSVPTIKIGDEVIVGFSPESVNRALDASVRR